jgi:hypothetical protein
MASEQFITKNTNSDKRRILSSLIEDNYSIEGQAVYSYLMDFDDTFIYFEIYSRDTGAFTSFRATYTYNGTTAVFGDDVVEVVRKTSYEVVVPIEDTSKSLVEKVVDGVLKALCKQPTYITKFKQEEQISLEVLYIHPEDIDLVGDGYSDDSCEALVKSFNEELDKGTIQPNFFHKVPAVGYFEIGKAYRLEEDMLDVGDSVVKAGTPVVPIHWSNDIAWELRKSGELGAPSIGARATVTEV